MTEADLTEFEIEQEGMKLRIRRGSETKTIPAMTPEVNMAPVQQASSTAEIQVETNVEYIQSPMVGTFYASPSPESSAFVSPGDKVSEESVVCIIEAMKVINEIHAEMNGTIVEAMVQNGQPVEYGQPLFKIKKA